MRFRSDLYGDRRPEAVPGAAAPVATVALALALAACSSSVTPSGAPPKTVVAAASPKDDGQSAQGGEGGAEHAAALEQLRIAPLVPRIDKQASVRIPLPDAEHWTRVRFLTVPSLVGFRYGKGHHAIVAAFVTHVDDNEVQGACSRSFEGFAQPMVDAFEVDLKHDPPSAFPWSPAKAAGKPRGVAIVEVDPLVAKTATLLLHESYAAAWAAYPAWEKACLVIGVAVPMRDEESRAREVRDRFVSDVLPKVETLSMTEPPARY